MPRTRADLLERQLLVKGLGALTRDRQPCADCGRNPLPGERVYLYGDDVLVCALCRPAQHREPDGTQVVRHIEHGATVRRIARAA